MDTVADIRQKDPLKRERRNLERVRSRNRMVSERATRRAQEIERASERSERVVERAMTRLRSAGVIR